MKPLRTRAMPALLLLLLCAAAPGFSLSITEIDGSASMVFLGSNPLPVSSSPGYLDPSQRWKTG